MPETALMACDGPSNPAPSTPAPAHPERRQRYEAHGLMFLTPQGAAAFAAWRADNDALTLDEALDRIFARQAAAAAQGEAQTDGGRS